MRYDFDVTVPANTLESDPVEERLKLCAGKLRFLGINFPAGCQGMVHAVIEHEGVQKWPLTTWQSFHGEDMAVELEEYYDLADIPYELVVHAWSPGTSYDHTITVSAVVLPAEIVDVDLRLEDKFNQFFKLLGVT